MAFSVWRPLRSLRPLLSHQLTLLVPPDMDRSASKRQQEHIRIQGIDLFQNGKSPKEIALQLGVRLQSVYHWVRLYKAHGQDGLRAKPQNGNPKITNKALIEEIRQLLATDPTTIGLDQNHWNGPVIVQALKKRWGIEIHPKYVYRWLDRNGLKGILDREAKSSCSSPSEC